MKVQFSVRDYFVQDGMGRIKIHVFYAIKMGEEYEKRYRIYFKNPDIIRHDMQHEELFCYHSEEWVEEVRKAVEVLV